MEKSNRRLRNLAILAIVSVALAGCGPERTFPPPIPTATPDWSIQLSQTGGFAGIDLFMEVGSEGEMTVEDRRAGKRASVPVSAATVKDIDRLLQEADLPEEGRFSSPCADCFLYELEVASGLRAFHVLADDTTLSQSGARELIEYLVGLRDGALRSST